MVAKKDFQTFDESSEPVVKFEGVYLGGFFFDFEKIGVVFKALEKIYNMGLCTTC